jgi:hypothetical protein
MKKIILITILHIIILSCNTVSEEKTENVSPITSNTSTTSNIKIISTPYALKSEALILSEAMARNSAIQDTERKKNVDKKFIESEKIKYDNEAKIINSSLNIDDFTFNYSNKWKIITKSDKSVTLSGTESKFIFNISNTPSSQIVEFTSYLIKSWDFDIISKKVLNQLSGYIIEAQDSDNKMHKIITMSSNNKNLIILSMESSLNKWELNSELFDLLFESLKVKSQ